MLLTLMVSYGKAGNFSQNQDFLPHLSGMTVLLVVTKDLLRKKKFIRQIQPQLRIKQKCGLSKER